MATNTPASGLPPDIAQMVRAADCRCAIISHQQVPGSTPGVRRLCQIFAPVLSFFPLFVWELVVFFPLLLSATHFFVYCFLWYIHDINPEDFAYSMTQQGSLSNQTHVSYSLPC